MEKDNKVILINQSSLTVTGIKKVLTVSESSISLILYSSAMTVLGEGMEVKKLDVDSGILEINGKINNIKYLVKKEKIGLIKRIFK